MTETDEVYKLRSENESLRADRDLLIKKLFKSNADLDEALEANAGLAGLSAECLRLRQALTMAKCPVVLNWKVSDCTKAGLCGCGVGEALKPE